MERILGIDLGTNSIGWALVKREDEGHVCLECKGVDIFQEGVARENGKEIPAVKQRTEARAQRRHNFRRRLRKIEVLKVLIKYKLCPELTGEQLEIWKKKKEYPITDAFISWQRTNDNEGKNPYYDRYSALNERLDLNNEKERYILGRALYHLSQLRGFLSNRKDMADSNDGVVKAGIAELTKEMKLENCNYLGELFFLKFKRGEKIRSKYISRKEHCESEFNAICEKQNLPQNLRNELKHAIFFQRKLKSQKGLVGKCTFERNKNRCPISHPRFEEFRMFSFINNIRIISPGTDVARPLSNDERKLIIPLFMRKSVSYFNFEEIAKKIAGKGNYICNDISNEKSVNNFYRFNYTRTLTVSACPVTASLKSIFGEDWINEIRSVYILAENKNEDQVINDVWHVLFSFDDDERLKTWAMEKLQLNEDEATKFIKIKIPQGYSSLSLKAINNILPFLRAGYRYDSAVFAANLKAVLPQYIVADKKNLEYATEDIISIIEDYKKNPLNAGKSKEECVVDELRDKFNISETKLKRLYHPSMIDIYPSVNTVKENRLGSPRTYSLRNPMAMRALFRLRVLINKLISEKKIDRYTKINIEFARELNNANMRIAIGKYQKERETERQKNIIEIKELYFKETGKEIVPTDEEILKYQLWKEQNHKCIYTSKEINITAFIGAGTAFDIEHTIPRSRGGDDSIMNKTLCESNYNRNIKIGKIPSELSDYEKILARIETLGWAEKIENLRKQIENAKRNSRNAVTKEKKDEELQKRNVAQLKLDYWKGKYERFMMKEIPDGFSNRQGVDIGIIGKYARAYLKTYFEHIYTVKGATTAEFRKMWGLQDEYVKKERANHIHHCIDAIVIACIGRKEYENWAHYKKCEEEYEVGKATKPYFEKPWPTFSEDVKSISNEVFVSHYTPDNMPKQTRKKMRVRGKVKLNKEGKPIYLQGDSARGILHRETFYGAIERNGKIKYVIRKRLGDLKPTEIEKIVDDIVRQRVKRAVDEFGFKNAIDTSNPDYTIWMNEEKNVPIKKVRIYAKLTEPIPLKKQRDLSDKDYKQRYLVANETNYCMAVYEGKNGKGKIFRSSQIVSNIDAAQYFKVSAAQKRSSELVPMVNDKGYKLKYILKKGTTVLFYKDSSEELLLCTKQELVKRLYKIKKLDKDGRVTFVYHQEARNQNALKEAGCEKPKSFVDVNDPYPLITLSMCNLNMCVEGYEFYLSVTGEVEFKIRKQC